MAKGNRRWIHIVGLLVLVSLLASAAGFWAIGSLFEKQRESRVAAILEFCAGNQDQDNVLRAILATSLDTNRPASARELIQLRRVYERTVRKTAEGKSVRQMRFELVEDLMEPLGGFNPTVRDLQGICRDKLRKAHLPVPPDLQD